MSECEFDVAPQALEQHARSVLAAVGAVRATGPSVASVVLPPHAFGGTKHGLLIGSLAAEFRSGVHARVAHESDHLEAWSNAVMTSAVRYELCDDASADRYRDLVRDHPSPFAPTAPSR